MPRSRSPRRGAVLPQVVLVARDRDAAGSAAAGTAAAGSAGAKSAGRPDIRAKAQQLSVAGEVVLENLLGAAAASRAAAAAAAGPAAGSAAVPAAGSRAVPAAGGGKGGGGKGGGGKGGGRSREAGSGHDWDYDEATRIYRKRWPTSYCVSWFDDDRGCHRPALWTLDDLEFPALSGRVHVEEVWTWKWLEGI